MLSKIVANEGVGMNLPDYDFNAFLRHSMGFSLVGKLTDCIIYSFATIVRLLIFVFSYNSSHAFLTSVKVLPFNEALAINCGSFEISESFKFIYFSAEKNAWF